MLWKRRALSTDIAFMTISDSPGGIEGFSSIGGFFRQFELALIAANGTLIAATKDASLIVRSDAGFVAAGSSSDYLPSVKARAELLDGKGDKVLYREFFAYGFNGQTAKDTVNLTAAPECRFPDFDALLSQPDLARKCLATGVEAVAKAIANDLKR